MRTKTLLLAAAVGVACAATTMAQVYSVNAVGYINLNLLPGFNMVANQLNVGGNTLGEVMPTMPDQTAVYTFDPATGYDIATYVGFLNGWDKPELVLAPGGGAWVLIPDAAGETQVTFVGEVPQGTLSTDLPAAFAIVSSQVPQEGHLSNDLGFPAADGDVLYSWANPGGYTVHTFVGFLNDWDVAPVVGVGQAVWSLKAAADTWTREFSVNQ